MNSTYFTYIKAAVAAFFLNATSAYAQNAVYPNPGTVFDRKLHSIRILIPQDSFNHMVSSENIWSNHKYRATFIYDEKDTIYNVGIRIKGNTSRNANRKSFRIDINAFEKQTFQGLKNLNIHGNHNDPSMSREYLSAFAMNQAEVPCLRVNFVKFYINNQYLGVRANSEFIDKTFLLGRFNNDKGNLYKCTWPADLVWLGSDQNKYKEIINNPILNERAYELKTNETKDDYSDLVNLINVINNSPKDSFPARLERIFDVQMYLRTLAMEVLNGHWDNYYANKNNYYLYNNPSTGKFIYLPYDMDNTFGVQWGFSNINNRDIYNWGTSSSAAPLTKNILSHIQYRRDYEFYIKNLLQDAWHRDSLYAELDYINQLIQSDMKNDPFFDGTFTNDYGYTFKNWQESYTSAWGNHVSFGIKPYIFDRSTSAVSQFKFLGIQNPVIATPMIYPNPSKEGRIMIQIPEGFSSNNLQVQVVDWVGRLISNHSIKLNSHSSFSFDLESVTPGNYFIRIGDFPPIPWIKLSY